MQTTEPLSPEQQNKLRRMTIQVGAIGSDGIVLASDKVYYGQGTTELDFDDQVMGRKIVDVTRHKIAFAFAGDWFSEDLGEAIVRAMDDGLFDFSDIRSSTRKVLAERYASEKRMPNNYPPRSVLLLFYGSDSVQLWKIAIERNVAYPIPVTERIVIAGASRNNARFLQRYAPQNLPVDRLKFLAAHIVCVASRIDPTCIKGLDIVVATKNGLSWVEPEEIKLLRKRSRSLERLLSRRLLSSS